MEGEENKLTTFTTWTIMLGCNESNIIFQQHLCKLGQLRRSNGRNSQVLGQAMKKRPTGHYKKYSHFKGRDTAPTTSSREGSCIVDSSTSGERTLWLQLKSLAGGARRALHMQFYHVTTEDDEKFCTALPIHLRVQSTLCLSITSPDGSSNLFDKLLVSRQTQGGEGCP